MFLYEINIYILNKKLQIFRIHELILTVLIFFIWPFEKILWLFSGLFGPLMVQKVQMSKEWAVFVFLIKLYKMHLLNMW